MELLFQNDYMAVLQSKKAKLLFLERIQFDGFPSLMADFQSIKSNEVQLSIEEAAWSVCHVSVMDTPME